MKGIGLNPRLKLGFQKPQTRSRGKHLLRSSELLNLQLGTVFCFPVVRANTLSLWLMLAGTGCLSLAVKKGCLEKKTW